LDFCFLKFNSNQTTTLKQKIQTILKSDFFRKFSIYGFGQFFNLVTPLLLIPYIVLVCGEENFGKISVAISISFFLIVFIDYGSELIGVRDISINRNDVKKRDEIYLTNLCARFFVLLFVIAISLLAIFCIPFLKQEATLYSLTLLVVIGQYFNQSWFLQAVDNMVWISLSNIISKLIYLIGVLLLVTKPQDYIYVNFYFGLGTLISSSIFTILIFKKYKIHFKLVSLQSVKQFLVNDFKILSSQIFGAVQLYSPVILVSIVGGNFVAGQYRIVEQIIVTFKTYIFLFFNFTYPRVCYDLAEKKLSIAKKNWSVINAANVLFVIFLMTVLFIYAEKIIVYFNGSDVLYLSSLLRVAIFIPITLAISIALKQLILAFDYQKKYVFITAISVILSTMGIYFSYKSYKLYGAFYSLIIVEVIVILFYLFCILRKNHFLDKNA
jgi:O-antigen/teichoic acid export membrane protein